MDNYIICAAIWVQDNVYHYWQPVNIEEGYVVAGRRHHNCFYMLYIFDKAAYFDKTKITQGFLTSDNRFVGREEAADIAYNVGQISEPVDYLFSENLY